MDFYNTTATNEQLDANAMPSVAAINLPKGGGAIKSIDEKFSVNAVNGTAAFVVPFPLSASRNSFMPGLSLSYSSGNGNGPFGLGWNADPGFISRRTDKQLPQYNDADESDTFIFSGIDDLVPALIKNDDGSWTRDEASRDGLTISRYRPRIEGGFARIEKITEAGNVYWKVTTGGNVVTLFGKSRSAQLADPQNANRIYKWLPEFSYDDRGNCFQYEYKAEDLTNVQAQLHERNRLNGLQPISNCYLKRVKYGNRVHFNREKLDLENWDNFKSSIVYLLELVLDYGEHDVANPQPGDDKGWPCRPDPFSQYQAGFEIRTYRLCQRLLMFHHFAELGDEPCLVRAMELEYDEGAAITFLKKLTLKGYIRQPGGGYTSEAMPPVEYSYQPLGWDTQVRTLAEENLENLPTGIDAAYQFLDLYGEGISGIFTEQAGGWYYKSNNGDGLFSAAALVGNRPALAGIGNQLYFQDIEANGRLSLVSNALHGYFELAPGGEWRSFQHFSTVPNINLNDPNLRQLDLTGDGQPDLLLSEDDVLVWYPAKGKEGFGDAQRMRKTFDEEKGPDVIFSNTGEAVLLADMSGTGLRDIVRIRNREVVYWPNLGYGKFGSKVTMSNPPVFDQSDHFNPAYIKPTDLDGSGTTDLVYLGADTFQIYFNQSGNSWSTVNLVSGVNPLPFFKVDNQANVLVTDLLGNGTGCIVWSSPLPAYGGRQLQYIDLMGGKKPHVLTGYKNNMGKEVSLNYLSSTSWYLADKKAGTPWVTRLPFPIQCVSQAVSIDHIHGSRFTSQYSYHHGYYDHVECEFRGFGRVEQTDTEAYVQYRKSAIADGAQLVEEAFYEPPVLTKTWFHTGALLDHKKIWDQFESEYFQNGALPEKPLTDAPLPVTLTTAELREAARACKGTILRTEVYSPDGSSLQHLPYVTTRHSCLLHLVEPREDNRYAVFMLQPAESLTYNYERNPTDPRIAHQLVVAADQFGNVLKAATVAYGRQTADAGLTAAEQAAQSQISISFSLHDFTAVIDTETDYLLPLGCQSQSFELTGVKPADGNYFTVAGLADSFNSAALIPFEAFPDQTIPQKRLIDQICTLFLKADMSGPLGQGVMQAPALVYQSYKLALTPGLREAIYAGKVDESLLTGNGKYVHFNDENYWVPSGTQTLDQANFYQLVQATDAFGYSTYFTYEPDYRFFVQQVTDMLQNQQHIVGYNYRTLLPYLVRDMNDNLSGVRMDALGLVTQNFVMGKAGENKGDLLDDTSAESSPTDQPTSVLAYNLFNYLNTGKPNYAQTQTRETHYFDAQQSGQPVNWQTAYTYFNGGGDVLMHKIQAEPGLALQENDDGTVTEIDTTPSLRWIGNGRTKLNNKGKPVKQYEPYFSTTPDFEDDSQLVERGVTSVMYYDSIGRLIKTELPDGTFTRVQFDAWKQSVYDQNDTVLESQWYSDRIIAPVSGIATPDEVAAANKAAAHANTPLVTYFDTLGRSFLTIADNGASGRYKTFSTFDIKGNVLQITDARGNDVMQYKYDMLSNMCYHISTGAGERWLISNIAGKALGSWDSRGHHFRYEYDNLHRLLKSYIATNDNPEINFDKISYGEGLPGDKQLNLRGKVYQAFDAAGVITKSRYDFKGNLLQSSRQLCQNYQTDADWNSDQPLQTEEFTTTKTVDALNRPLSTIYPDQTKIRITYNEGGLLSTVAANLRGGTQDTAFINSISYDVKRRRQTIGYGNSTQTSYQYDAQTFRLTQLLTTGQNGSNVFQQLAYTYDPAGNICHIADAAQQTNYFNNSVVNPSCDYVYDAIYRLITATGREHIGQQKPPSPFDEYRTNLSMPGDGQAMTNYTENYTYDEAGNILQMAHIAGANTWTRTYDYAANSNRLAGNTVGGNTENFNYDAHGNILSMAHLPQLGWNFKDRLQLADLGGGGQAWYVYDSSGQRIRKIIERQGGIKEERIYLGGFELYRITNSAGDVQQETESVHITDDTGRIALIETLTVKDGDEISTSPLIRYQYGNQLGSAVLELNEQGTIISYEEYYPYGATAYQSVNAVVKAAAKRYRYTGMERDEETGLEYHSARYYLPWLGRWLSSDPIDTGGGLNFYEYCNSSPIGLNDLTGNAPETPGPVKRFFRKALKTIVIIVSLDHTDAATHAPSPIKPPMGQDEKTIKRDEELKRESSRKNQKKKQSGGSPPPDEPDDAPPPTREESSGVKSETSAVKAEEEAAKTEGAAIKTEKNISKTERAIEGVSKGAKIGAFIEAMLPGPEDVFLMFLQDMASIAEAKDQVREKSYALGYAEGVAAQMLGLPPSWVMSHLTEHNNVGNSVGEIAAGFENIRQNAQNLGTAAGYIYGRQLNNGDRTLLLTVGVLEYNDLHPNSHIVLTKRPGIDEVIGIAVGLLPTITKNLEETARIERENREREEFKRRKEANPTYGHNF